MARSLLVGLALCGLVLVGASAEAGLRRGCKGGSCGVSYSGCANGSCSVQAPVQKGSPSDVPPAPPAPSAEVKPAEQPAVASVEVTTPTTQVSVNTTRAARGRLFRRAR